MPDILYCSFCNSTHHQVSVLVAGPRSFICDDCVDTCAEIIREKRKTAKTESDLVEPAGAVIRGGTKFVFKPGDSFIITVEDNMVAMRKVSGKILDNMK